MRATMSNEPSAMARLPLARSGLRNALGPDAESRGELRHPEGRRLAGRGPQLTGLRGGSIRRHTDRRAEAEKDVAAQMMRRILVDHARGHREVLSVSRSTVTREWQTARTMLYRYVT